MHLFSSTYRTLFVTLVCALFMGCTKSLVDETPSDKITGIRLSMNNISTLLQTRATPSEIGAPKTTDFTVNITNPLGVSLYSDKYKGEDDLIELPIGEYKVTASYGNLKTFALDRPAYTGSIDVTVKEDEQVNCDIQCKVGNCLISITYNEQERFDRFYSEYYVTAKSGETTLSLSPESAKSIYFPAGPLPTLTFYGKDTNGRWKNYALTSQSLPANANAADHFKLTLSLPEAEAATGIEVTKVEMTEANLDETIPLSWLPAPTATAQHKTDAAGYLVGTDIVFGNSYPGMMWRAEVTNADGVVVRNFIVNNSTDATATSSYDAQEWPYLPAGKYKATYYLTADGKESKTRSREFRIEKPQLVATISGWTSYDKYTEGKIDEANECEGNKAYGVTHSFLVAESLAKNPKYSETYSYKFLVDDKVTNLTGTEIEGLTFAKHTLATVGTFDGAEARADMTITVTGLPYDADATQYVGWTGGRWCPSGDTGEGQAREPGEPSYVFANNIYSPKFYVPNGESIKCKVDFRVWFYAATMRNTNYGFVSSTSATPSGNSANPKNYTWTSLSMSDATITPTASYFALTHQSGYTWAINNVKILYK